MITNSRPYRRLYHDGALSARLTTSLELMKRCKLCPRECGIDRLSGETGFCRTGRRARIASYHAHFGEEAPLVGRHGSGTIFISHCNLLCSFCQNFEISHLGEGREVKPEHLAAMMVQLQEEGCHNINFVTPTHVVPQIIESLIIAVEQGLTIPLVYNSGGYDKVETLKLLDGIVDIYMPDFKFGNSSWAGEFCSAMDYFDVASAAITEMHRQVGDLEIGEDGIATRGLLVRHLVMPNGVADTEKIMTFIATEISPHTYVNVMDQYHPCGHAREDGRINRRISPAEYTQALGAARDAGLTRLDSPLRLFRWR
ncbi:MAG: radical SAM protein [Deltaproteobacteria bacterium]|nr:radical SAM protein [Deltaproteobacteria bacterium]MBN2686575.1 radical SAM protein [Deltaproteobacteria bacterium]